MSDTSIFSLKKKINSNFTLFQEKFPIKSIASKEFPYFEIPEPERNPKQNTKQTIYI